MFMICVYTRVVRENIQLNLQVRGLCSIMRFIEKCEKQYIYEEENI